MLILHVITRGAGGGTNRALKDSIKFEIGKGHDVILCRGQIDKSLSDISYDNDSILIFKHLRRKINPVRDVLALIEMRKVFKKLKPDVVHSHESKAGVLCRLASIGLPILKVHTYHMQNFGATGVMNYLFRSLEAGLSRFTDVGIYVGRGLKNFMNTNNVKCRNELIIRSRIGIESFLTATTDCQLDDIQTKGLRPYILTAGLLEERKRIDQLILSLGPKLEYWDMDFVIAGEGKLREKLEQIISDNNWADRIKMIGFTEQIQVLMKNAELYVHAARREGVSQSIIHALATGLPVVAVSNTSMDDLPTANWFKDVNGDFVDKCEEILIQDSPSLIEASSKVIDSEQLNLWLDRSINIEHTKFLDLLVELRTKEY